MRWCRWDLVMTWLRKFGAKTEKGLMYMQTGDQRWQLYNSFLPVFLRLLCCCCSICTKAGWLFCNPHLRIYFLLFFNILVFLERETSMWEKNLDGLPPIPGSNPGSNPQSRYVLDQELSPQPCGVEDNVPTKWATWAKAVWLVNTPNLRGRWWLLWALLFFFPQHIS